MPKRCGCAASPRGGDFLNLFSYGNGLLGTAAIQALSLGIDRAAGFTGGLGPRRARRPGRRQALPATPPAVTEPGRSPDAAMIVAPTPEEAA